jgi:tyrosinase
MAIRTRKDVWKLDEWDPILIWYARAIADMKGRRFVQPQSWRYQAAIHDYAARPDQNTSDPPPPQSEQDKYWKQCQHFSWFFLPWHRMYLAYFEQIVGDTIVRLGGDPNWALPYWNYSDASNPNARKLPPAFIADKMPDGALNPLRVAARDAGNDGEEVTDARGVDISNCLGEPHFEADPPGGAVGFGGPRTGFKHTVVPGESNRVGSLEQTPHGDIHSDIGGWMGYFNTAGLDPIFWLHHCNIPPIRRGSQPSPSNSTTRKGPRFR